MESRIQVLILGILAALVIVGGLIFLGTFQKDAEEIVVPVPGEGAADSEGRPDDSGLPEGGVPEGEKEGDEGRETREGSISLPGEKGEASDPENEDPGPGEVFGSVWNRRTNKPVSEAAVTVRGKDRGGSPVGEGVTDERGMFRLREIPGGAEYLLRVEKPGYKPAARADIAVPKEGGVQVGRVDLDPLPILEGRVLDKKGKPVGGAEVQLTEEFGVKMGPGVSIIDLFRRLAAPEKMRGETRADAEGKFTFWAGEVEEGESCLRASAPGFAMGFLHFVTVKAGGDAKVVEVVLGPKAGIRGKVVDPSKAPVEGAIVVALGRVRGSEEQEGILVFNKVWTYTGEDGTFRFENLVPLRARDYVVIAKKEGYSMTIQDNVAVPSEEEIVLELQLGFALEGRVVDDGTGKGISGASLLAMGRRDSGFGQAKSDAEGRYRIESLGAGDYKVLAAADGYTPEEVKVKGGPGEVIQQDIRLKGGLTVFGVVLDAQSRKPLEGVTVFVVSQGDEAMLTGSIVKDETGPDGTFSLEGAILKTRGRWDPKTRTRIETQWLQLAAVKAGWVQEKPINLEVSPGVQKMEGIEVLLQAAPKVSGRVINAMDAPVVGAEVQAVSLNRMPSEMIRMLGMTPEVVKTDTEGKFAMHIQLGKGATLWIRHPDYAPKIHSFDALAPGMEVKGLEIRLSAGGTVEGVVLNEGGAPVAGEEIGYRFRGRGEGDREAVFEHPAVRRSREVIRTDENGRFRIPHLRP
ncbi:MAG: MSCRAMM family protein, partial [Planctomycetota bacterium]